MQVRFTSGGAPGDTCRLTINLLDKRSNRTLAGLVRITDIAQDKPLVLNELILRDNNWYAMPSGEIVALPRTGVRIEAMHGLEFERQTRDLDLGGKSEASVDVSLTRFYSAADKGLVNGNTHLHLRRLTHAEADRYLRIVPKADGLDLVFLSHLRRIPDERHYISNMIVENSLAGGDLERLSQGGVLFRPGQEHRNNFTGYGEGYGHVMFLDIVKLIRPVSIGPGIMKEGTDGIPLRRGIDEAHRDGATVVWCHNTFGYEDLPNWMAGVLDAQNIFDGGNHGSYKETFYRYLNLGMKVPFSTGTDWFIYDFSRVYVPINGLLTSDNWLTQLVAGRTFITNGPLLEFEAEGSQIGDTIRLDKAKEIRIRSHASGRADFKSIELIHNGEVIKSAASKPVDGHFVAELQTGLAVDTPGWIAVRASLDAGKNEFGKQLFAHTSPIYLELAGRQIFRHEIAEQLITEMQQNIEVVGEKAKFADEKERNAVLKIHQEGLATLKERIAQHR